MYNGVVLLRLWTDRPAGIESGNLILTSSAQSPIQCAIMLYKMRYFDEIFLVVAERWAARSDNCQSKFKLDVKQSVEGDSQFVFCAA